MTERSSVAGNGRSESLLVATAAAGGFAAESHNRQGLFALLRETQKSVTGNERTATRYDAHENDKLRSDGAIGNGIRFCDDAKAAAVGSWHNCIAST